jgi:hypothetical protein
MPIVSIARSSRIDLPGAIHRSRTARGRLAGLTGLDAGHGQVSSVRADRDAVYIVEAHRGRVVVASHPGVGSTFTVDGRSNPTRASRGTS